tara:strand:- start:12642 stop:13457 length:816 start_codon:yes stop_codon:yes gene_type:complete
MQKSSNTLLKDWTKYITANKTSPILYRDYQTLKNKSKKTKYKEKYKKYEDSILKDLPRSYPKSHWLSNKTNKNLIKDILRCWLCYSEIGYIQSMLFYLIPLACVFKKTPHMAFWGFVYLFNNVSPFLRETLDPEYNVHTANTDSNDVLYKISICYYNRHGHILTDMQKSIFYLIINYKIHAKCAVGHLSTCLQQATMVLDHLIRDIHEEDKFIQSLKSVSFSTLLCLIIDKSPDELSDKFLMDINQQTVFTTDSIDAILKSARSAEEIFKY